MREDILSTTRVQRSTARVQSTSRVHIQYNKSTKYIKSTYTTVHQEYMKIILRPTINEGSSFTLRLNEQLLIVGLFSE